MQHLSETAFARLADGSAYPSEAEHLAVCPQCRAQLQMFRADLDALRGLPRLAPPRAEWERLAARIATPTPWRRTAIAFATLAVASAVFMVGVVAGRRSAPAPVLATHSPVSSREATARLAAFEAVLLTTREAVRRTPGDPVLMAYERIAITARDSALSAVRLTSSKQWY